MDLVFCFWLLSGNNDLNILDKSWLVLNLLSIANNEFKFRVNGVEYLHYYLMVDDIYSRWNIFVTTIHEPQWKKRCHFAKQQETYTKDVEWCFRVLRSCWEIIQNLSKLWDKWVLANIILYVCIILHNMIIKYELYLNLKLYFD